MTDTQILTIAMSTAPTMLIVLVGILINNARLGDLSSNFNSRFNDLNVRIGETNAHLGETNARIAETHTRIAETNARIGETDARIGELRSHMDVRFEEMKDLWRSELHRVEEVIDARLKHIEER
jgi:peptidoglycan hydrolase CwlO-like protein